MRKVQSLKFKVKTWIYCNIHFSERADWRPTGKHPVRLCRHLHRHPPAGLHQRWHYACLFWRHRYRRICRHQPYTLCHGIRHFECLRRAMGITEERCAQRLCHRHVLDPWHERGHHLLLPYSGIHARSALFPLRKYTCHRQHRPLASGRSYPVCSIAVHLSVASYPDHRIRQHLCKIATSAGYSDRIYDDDAHRHDHRGNHQDGGHRTCHQSAHHTTDDSQPLHLQLQTHDRSQHRDRLHRLHRRPLCQLSAQCAIRCNHHLRQHYPVCSSKDTGSQKALRLSHALKEKF